MHSDRVTNWTDLRQLAINHVTRIRLADSLAENQKLRDITNAERVGITKL